MPPQIRIGSTPPTPFQDLFPVKSPPPPSSSLLSPISVPAARVTTAARVRSRGGHGQGQALLLGHRRQAGRRRRAAGHGALGAGHLHLHALAPLPLPALRHPPVSVPLPSLRPVLISNRAALLAPGATRDDPCPASSLPTPEINPGGGIRLFLLLLVFSARRRWYTMVHADGSVVKTYEHLREHGVVEGLKAIWPMPTVVAWKIIFGFGLFEAVLQLLLPGKRFEGPISPAGNVPVYKANGLQAYAVTLITYLGLWW
ncbi:hypothetical protein HU200_014334 [Digitaria exilis]|uniref:Uncharacterized protein n=1 Tax=Digitaria exilis TaxID=1010633 RepID=A0A835FBM4_9POAL|nr:hypothetical protein HU200_014334 [Digitaria exilis]